jgi:formate hydrogenlyase subunit 4
MQTSRHLLLALVLAPLLLGIVNRVKARFAGRQGKPLLQTYFDLAKLARKGAVLRPHDLRVFAAGPTVSLAAIVCALLLVPAGGTVAPVRFAGDFMVMAYLLGLSRLALILAALDTGSSFEGMGASREACFSALAEPVLFLCFLCLIIRSDGLSLSAFLQTPAAHLTPESLFVPAVLFVLLLTENARIPVDDPNTHLELTMIHEVMVLDHSGRTSGSSSTARRSNSGFFPPWWSERWCRCTGCRRLPPGRSGLAPWGSRPWWSVLSNRSWPGCGWSGCRVCSAAPAPWPPCPWS